jgi:hypothetical protein
MKNKTIGIITVLLLGVITLCAAAVFAVTAWDNLKTQQNKVAIGAFVRVEMTGIVDGAEVDSADNLFTAAFTASIAESDEKAYNLVLVGISFYDEDNSENTAPDELADTWVYSTDGGEHWYGLLDTGIVLKEGISRGGSVTLQLKLKEGAAAEYVLYSLRFTVKLEEAA